VIEALHSLAQGLAIAAEPHHAIYTFVGVLVGTLIGMLPGIGPSAGIALLLPLTFGMEPAAALMMLAGIYYGAMYGGAISAILINTPGDAAAVMTVLDGYPMARAGRAGAALAIAAISSFIAGTLGVTSLTFIAGPLSSFALRFGPAEYFALMTFALSTASALAGDSLAKGALSTCIGLAISTIGIDLQSGTARFTMGIPALQEGVPFLVVVVGIFALGEAGRMIEDALKGSAHSVKVQGRLWFTQQDWWRALPAMIRGWAVGFFCGAAPGLGGTVAAMLAYNVEKRFARRPEELGKGAVEGVAAPEAATNADTCGAFVHLLSLGIPGSSSTAILMGAFIIYGIEPGPLLIRQHPHLIWGLIASMYLGNFMLLVLNLPLVGVFARILYLPPMILAALILGLIPAGVYAYSSIPLYLYLSLLFGLLGYVFRVLNIPRAPLIFGVILGGRLDQSLRQALTISAGNPLVFVESPIAATLLCLAALFIVVSLRARRGKSLAPKPLRAAKTH
jgi:putative tricarboxylic transport membrane protein